MESYTPYIAAAYAAAALCMFSMALWIIYAYRKASRQIKALDDKAYEA